MKKLTLCFVFAFSIFSVSALRASNKPTSTTPLVAHEWGTCTSLQDEQGNAIYGINADDEPVPAFVHHISQSLLLRNHGVEEEGVPRTHPDVTMRLETPVIYFYPPADWKPQAVDVHVAFKGGWLTEFYPNAVFNAPGFHPQQDGQDTFGHIDSKQEGDLTWAGLTLRTDKAGPLTNSKVWLAPRDVKSVNVTAVGGETDKFLFYRGVARADATLRIVRNTKDNTLQVRDNGDILDMENAEKLLRVNACWLVDIRPDGTCAFKSVGPLEYGKEIRATVPASFADVDFSTENMARLRGEMQAALVQEGLFADEAAAMLNTWEVSYFKSPGLRFFYLYPRTDIDSRLPLEFSVPVDFTRVLMGRIEIVTPGQRALLKSIPAGNPVAQKNTAYDSLGRFRNALILNEQRLRPTKALNAFIAKNRLQAFVVD